MNLYFGNGAIVALLSVAVDLATLTSIFVQRIFAKTDAKMIYEMGR